MDLLIRDTQVGVCPIGVRPHHVEQSRTLRAFDPMTADAVEDWHGYCSSFETSSGSRRNSGDMVPVR